MAERILFLTGHLARPRLEKVLARIEDAGFDWSIFDVGVKVAALMTEAIISRRVPRPVQADRILVPGRCRADLDRLSADFGVRFERGPEELKDLPAYFGKHGRGLDLSRQDMRIFAEIVDASALTVDAIVARAIAMRAAGADVIDLGCLPDTAFPHLEDAVRELKAAGLTVSVDSAAAEELRRAAKAGAAFLLSLTEHTLDIARDSDAIPVLIPANHGDLESLLRAAESADKRGISPILDPILDPIHFGFTASLQRYAELRHRLPQADILMGTGNLTELTDADSGGVTATLLGVCSELSIRNVLVVQVSPHTRRTIQEHDAARRMMFAAREDDSLPRDYGGALVQLHDRAAISRIRRRKLPSWRLKSRTRTSASRRPRTEFTSITEMATTSRRMLSRSFPKLGIGKDAPHAFYLGAELMKAEIAWRLGKRYAQDEPLDWGCGVDRLAEDRTRLREAGHTLRASSSAS